MISYNYDYTKKEQNNQFYEYKIMTLSLLTKPLSNSSNHRPHLAAHVLGYIFNILESPTSTNNN